MTHVTYVFPGQGSQKVGMAKDLFDTVPASKAVIDEAKNIIGEGPVNLMFDDPNGKLDKTENAQPLIFIASMASLIGYLAHNPLLRETLPLLVFGHSLGELTALVVGGVLSFEDGLKIAKIRGEIMASAPPGKMVVVRNIPDDHLRNLLDSFPIDIGVINTNSQIVLSGEEKAMNEAITYMKSQEIKARLLPISIASHSRVMQAVQGQFASALDNFTFRKPHTPIISVYQAQELRDGAMIKEAFVEQMTHTLDFPQMLFAAKHLGADTFVEFGPKGSSNDGIITGNIQALDSSLTAIGIHDLSSIKDRSVPF